MFRNLALGFPLVDIARFLGLGRRDKQTLSVCRDRMDMLDDPSTRKALASLPDHLLKDVGVTRHTPSNPDIPGEALRRHLW